MQQKNYLRRIVDKYPYRLISPAKINIYLNILEKFPDGYHRIISLVEKITLCDYIYLRINFSGKIKIAYVGFSIPTDGNNSICKAVRLFNQYFGTNVGLEVFIEKNIPPARGLGGHSSNSATIVKFLNRYLKINAPLPLLKKIFSHLSKDIPVFLEEAPFCIVEGKGEEVTPLNIFNKFNHLIWISPKGLSTSQVYQVYNTGLTSKIEDVNIITTFLEERKLEWVGECCFNALERSAVSLYPEIWKLKNLLVSKNIKIVGMSGSGPVIFCMDEDFKKVPYRWKGWYSIQAWTFLTGGDGHGSN